MSSIKYSAAAQLDLERLHAFLAQYDASVANRALMAIADKLDYISQYPDSGSPLPDRTSVRKSIVDFGANGYLIFHKRYALQDTNLVTRIIHQKEWYDAKTIGVPEEQA